MTSRRRVSKPIRIGNALVGGGAPIVVQSMTKTDTADVAATLDQISQLEEHGCEIVRVAVPNMEAAEALPTLKKASSIPLVADIHFDYRLALAAIHAGVDALRLNPGNLGEREQVLEVARQAKERGIPIRVGVNAGSLPRNSSSSLPVEEQMVAAALGHVKLLESIDFDLIKVSLKAFDVPTTIRAYEAIATLIPYPLHLGITEAGTLKRGLVRSAVGIGILLYLGIGDTLRVSLSTSPVEEVIAAYEILKSLDLREHGPTLVSCPSCGRAEADVTGLAQAVDERLASVKEPIKVAVMGCVVNGPGEAREADVGIACGRGKGAIFRKGKVVRVVQEEDFLETMMAEIDRAQRCFRGEDTDTPVSGD